MNISLAFELQGPVTADLIAKAWALVKQEFPYFASTIHQDEHGQLHFKSPDPEKVLVLPAMYLLPPGTEPSRFDTLAFDH